MFRLPRPTCNAEKKTEAVAELGLRRAPLMKNSATIGPALLHTVIARYKALSPGKLLHGFGLAYVGVSVKSMELPISHARLKTSSAVEIGRQQGINLAGRASKRQRKLISQVEGDARRHISYWQSNTI